MAKRQSATAFSVAPVRDYAVEELFRLSDVPECFEEPGRGVVASEASVRPRVAAAQGLREVERLERLAGLAHFDEAFGADALRKPAQHGVVCGDEGQRLFRERESALGVALHKGVGRL